MRQDRVLDENGCWTCIHGHDKDVVGVAPNGRCNRCCYESKRAKMIEKGKGRGYRGQWQHIKNLRSLRRKIGLSQREFGELCGVARSTIAMIENGRPAGYGTQVKILAAMAPIVRRMNR